ncbi:hypothetical protein B0H13DRAFT_1900314 [Mycena leptocephala]|nr:hypothetical protein B0H13DRAFT_1900314 [Mycena leptocephala]
MYNEQVKDTECVPGGMCYSREALTVQEDTECARVRYSREALNVRELTPLAATFPAQKQNLRNGHSPVKDKGDQYLNVYDKEKEKESKSKDARAGGKGKGLRMALMMAESRKISYSRDALNVRGEWMDVQEGMYSKWMEEWVVKGLNTRSRVGGTETQLIQSQNHCLLRKSDPPRLGGYDASRADLGWLEKRKVQNLRNGHSPARDRGGQYFEVSVRLSLEDNESVATKSKKMNPNPRLPELEAKAKAFGLRG